MFLDETKLPIYRYFCLFGSVNSSYEAKHPAVKLNDGLARMVWYHGPSILTKWDTLTDPSQLEGSPFSLLSKI